MIEAEFFQVLFFILITTLFDPLLKKQFDKWF